MPVIENVLTNYDIAQIAEFLHCHKGNEITSYKPFRRFVEYVLSEELLKAKLNPRNVLYVKGQPYKDADQMRYEFKHTGKLLISKDHNTDTLLGKTANLKFRTTHDLHHIQDDECQFNLSGEICAYEKFVKYAKNDPMLQRILFQEIVGQVCYLRVYGHFPNQTIFNCEFFDPFIRQIDKAYTDV